MLASFFFLFYFNLQNLMKQGLLQKTAQYYQPFNPPTGIISFYATQVRKTRRQMKLRVRRDKRYDRTVNLSVLVSPQKNKQVEMFGIGRGSEPGSATKDTGPKLVIPGLADFEDCISQMDEDEGVIDRYINTLQQMTNSQSQTPKMVNYNQCFSNHRRFLTPTHLFRSSQNSGS